MSEYCRNCYKLSEENEKYKQVLAEINERCQDILQNVLNHPQEKIDFAESILNKINEVLK